MPAIANKIHPLEDQIKDLTTPADEHLWHRLLGTLLSSQGPDAHRLGPFNPPRGNRSNLLELPAPT
jgi:hypothetical protein